MFDRKFISQVQASFVPWLEYQVVDLFLVYIVWYQLQIFQVSVGFIVLYIVSEKLALAVVRLANDS
jgi:hypothetical protein